MSSTVTYMDHTAKVWNVITYASENKKSTRHRVSDFTANILASPLKDGPLHSHGSLLEHIERVNKVNLSYPIIANPDTGAVYDGKLRLLKAILNKKKFIYVRWITQEEFRKL